MSAREQSTDSLLSFRVWADLFVVLGILTAFSTYRSIDQNGGGLLVVLASISIFFGYLIGTAYRSMVWLLRDRPRRTAASLAKLTVMLLPWVFWIFDVSIGDYVHLALCYRTYQQQIAARGEGSMAPVRFSWGDKAVLVTDGLQADTLVYDPIDALAASIGQTRDADQAGLGFATRHLIGHFYVEREFSR